MQTVSRNHRVEEEIPKVQTFDYQEKMVCYHDFNFAHTAKPLPVPAVNRKLLLELITLCVTLVLVDFNSVGNATLPYPEKWKAIPGSFASPNVIAVWNCSNWFSFLLFASLFTFFCCEYMVHLRFPVVGCAVVSGHLSGVVFELFSSELDDLLEDSPDEIVEDKLHDCQEDDSCESE